MPTFRPRLLPLAALTALTLLFFWRLAFTHLILARGDMFLYFYPYWEYRARALLAGSLPLWQPYLFMGAPFLANSQAGVLYPLNWPLAAFGAPTAVNIAIVAHVALAAAGAFAFARRGLALSELGAFTAAALFALGGYLTAQVEHINQLQGLAWLPWVLLMAHALSARAQAGDARWPRSLAALAAVVALQLLAGHTQSTFITLAGAGAWVVLATLLGGLPARGARWRGAVVGAAVLGLAAALAGALAAAQVLPTLELSGQSLRGGGLSLREALSFSLHPRLLGRSLLPGYSRALFSEFVAYSGVAGLLLAALGLRRTPLRLALAGLAGLGLLFALGAFNPLYAALALVPPFNLFRVPARWLVLLAFGLSLLAGCGLDEVVRQRPRGRQWLAAAVPLAAVALAPLATGMVAAGETGPLPGPAGADWAGWLLALGLAAGWLLLPVPAAWRGMGLAALAVVEIFLAGRSLPYNAPTSPAAYTSIRPAMTQLLVSRLVPAEPAGANGEPALIASSRMVTTVTSALPVPLALADGAAVPGRFLSMSALRFDPGDLAELRGALAGQLPPAAIDDFIVATKHKEVMSPNLPLAWDVPAVDGYDGGVLPLRHYAEFAQLFTGALSPDGRLRENLTAVPDPRLLSLVNAQYLISDKVGDAWIDGVFFDLQIPLALAPGEEAAIAYVPRFEATALAIAAEAYSGEVSVDFEDGSEAVLPITGGRVRFAEPGHPLTITLRGPLAVQGLSLVDERSGAFQSLALGPFRLAHSGDVKIYENLAVLPRAFVAGEARVVANDAAAREALLAPGFDPAATVLLAGADATAALAQATATGGQLGPAAIVAYSPERVEITAAGPGYLVLTDAYYPGWVAYLDGAEVPIYRADIAFRAVALPPGQHTVEFRYEPLSVRVGALISVLAVLAVVGLLVRGRTA